MTTIDDIQAAREWVEAYWRGHELSPLPRDTILCALNALEHEVDEYGEHGTHEDYMASKVAQVEATLASCARARRAVEEECERLRATCELHEEDVGRLRGEYEVSLAALMAERDLPQIDRDRLAALVATQQKVIEAMSVQVDTLTSERNQARLSRVSEQQAYEREHTRLRGVVACYEDDDGEGVTALIAERDRLAAVMARVETLRRQLHEYEKVTERAIPGLPDLDRALDGEVG